jgi:hypothetical protein
MVPPQLGERVPTELLEERLRDHERHHAFRNDAHRRNGGYITTLRDCLGSAAGVQIDCT